MDFLCWQCWGSGARGRVHQASLWANAIYTVALLFLSHVPVAKWLLWRGWLFGGGRCWPSRVGFLLLSLPAKKRAKQEGDVEEGGEQVGGWGRGSEMTEAVQKAGLWGFCLLLLAGVLGAFLYSALDLEMFPFPLIDRLQAATLSSVLLLACSSFPHFLYKERGRRGGENEGDGGQC
jgi:hypothetical protein